MELRGRVLSWYDPSEITLIKVGLSTDYLHGGSGRLNRGGIIWGLVGLCTVLVWLGL
jgi:hypothetical protein